MDFEDALSSPVEPAGKLPSRMQALSQAMDAFTAAASSSAVPAPSALRAPPGPGAPLVAVPVPPPAQAQAQAPVRTSATTNGNQNNSAWFGQAKRWVGTPWGIAAVTGTVTFFLLWLFNPPFVRERRQRFAHSDEVEIQPRSLFKILLLAVLVTLIVRFGPTWLTRTNR